MSFSSTCFVYQSKIETGHDLLLSWLLYSIKNREIRKRWIFSLAMLEVFFFVFFLRFCQYLLIPNILWWHILVLHYPPKSTSLVPIWISQAGISDYDQSSELTFLAASIKCHFSHRWWWGQLSAVMSLFGSGWLRSIVGIV